MARYKYLLHAYQNMAQWMLQGDEEILKLKRYVQRHFALPPKIHESMDYDDAEEVLTAFGYHYIDSLLRYCSDDLKPGIKICSTYFFTFIQHTHTHTHT